jgi:hypothetical protein
MEQDRDLFSFQDFKIPEFKKPKITNERQTIIKEFVDAINRERIGTKFKPITARAVAIKLGMLKSNRELYEFLSECKDYKNRNGSFGKRFFGSYNKPLA